MTDPIRPQTTAAKEGLAAWMLRVAIVSGCSAADTHLRCSWPECGCKTLPTQMRAGLAAVMLGLPSDATVSVGGEWTPADVIGQELVDAR